MMHKQEFLIKRFEKLIKMFDDHFGLVNEVIIQESISSDSVSVILSESIEERVNLNPISFH